jgi:ElaB/YqjD/DUF883 family membrane-anchored ribosome-binding protein
VGGIFGGLVLLYAQWKLIDGKRNRIEKDQAKQEFDKSKRENGQVLDELTLRLVDSVLKANERLQQDIDDSRTQLRELKDRGVVLQEKEVIKKLEELIAQLENLSVSAKLLYE